MFRLSNWRKHLPCKHTFRLNHKAKEHFGWQIFMTYLLKKIHFHRKKKIWVIYAYDKKPYLPNHKAKGHFGWQIIMTYLLNKKKNHFHRKQKLSDLHTYMIRNHIACSQKDKYWWHIYFKINFHRKKKIEWFTNIYDKKPYCL